MTDLERLKTLAAELYRLADDAGLIDAACLNPSGDDCERDCSDCGWYASQTRDELLRLGVDLG